MDQFIVFDIINSRIVKEKLAKILGGNNKKLFGQLLAQYLVYLARESRYLAQLTFSPISALLCQINQIFDSSFPFSDFSKVPHISV